MQKKHLILAIMVTLIWGLNFPITKLGLQSVDPFVLTGIRFALAAIPLVFIVKRPQVNFSYVVAYGLIFGIGMWGIINYGIYLGVNSGIASLIIQLSAFFTIGWGAFLFKEKVRCTQWLGALLAFFGLGGIIASQQETYGIYGLLCIIMSAMAWSIGNVIIKKSGVKEVFSFIVWASLFPPIPLLLFAWFLHGQIPYITLVQSLDVVVIFSIIFQVYLATHFAYWGWNSLLKLYPVSIVAPLSLLIPIFGLTSSMLLVGERISSFEMISILIIIMGLMIGFYKPSFT